MEEAEKEILMVGLDLETTGLDKSTCEIIELCAIEFDMKGNIYNKMYYKLRPESGFIPEGASRVNGIYYDQDQDPGF